MRKPLRSLDLFAGIGGFALGFHRAGIETAAFCEIDPYARRVLAKNFPGVPLYDDVRSLNGTRLAADGIGPIDIITGGFPCQDISVAGRGVGLSGERSGLWWEFHRIISEVRPRYAVIENSPALRSRGLEDVLRGLDEIGYDAEWHCIPAGAVGAPHRRDRVWVLADSLRERHRAPHEAILSGWDRAEYGCRWSPEPDVGRVAHGVPSRVDRLRCLGNAVVPVIPEIIGRAIIHHSAY